MSEFWPDERWKHHVIRHPTWFRRAICALLGHEWDTSYNTGMGEEGWPVHDYCLRCWKFRDKVEP